MSEEKKEKVFVSFSYAFAAEEFDIIQAAFINITLKFNIGFLGLKYQKNSSINICWTEMLHKSLLVGNFCPTTVKLN